MSRCLFDQKFGEEFLGTVPEGPGVYWFADATGQAVYVGKAKNLRRRLSQYRTAKVKNGRAKARRIVKAAATLHVETCDTELNALLRENALIREWQPELNISGAFSFLYPFLGCKYEPERTRLIVAMTLSPESLVHHGFQLAGAFRSRSLARAAFDALTELFSHLGHLEGSRLLEPYREECRGPIAGFRQLDPVWTTPLIQFLTGEDAALLGSLALALLEKPGAVRHAKTIEENLKLLKAFFRDEAVVLREALKACGSDLAQRSLLAQRDRDALFIRLRYERSTPKV